LALFFDIFTPYKGYKGLMKSKPAVCSSWFFAFCHLSRTTSTVLALWKSYLKPSHDKTPWLVTYSITTMITKPIIAARPFKRSAYSLKPNFGSSSLGVTLGCGCVCVCVIIENLFLANELYN
jgi:hypothetical protein